MDDDQTPHLRMDNPLSLDPESVWGRYFRNAELEKTIEKDITRLYPEHGVFFQSGPCQAMMRRILLVWSLIHPQFSYRQGMHELLGPLLYVLHVDVVRLSKVKHRFEDLFDDRFDSLSLQERHVRDKVELAKNFCGEMVVAGDSINFNEKLSTSTDVAPDPEEQRVDLSVIIQGSDMYGVEGELGALLSARFLEHDAYCMLDALLVGQGGAVAMADYFSSAVGGGKPPVIEASAALYRTLAAADITLYTHLVELGVEPQFFALRWLRVLFGREFLLTDLLRVWDAMFEADNTSSSLHGGEESSEMKFSQRSAIIFSFCVSMLLYVRPALLAAPDATACLQRLLNFPQVPDVRDLIESAKSLQLLAKAASMAPGPPVPRNTRSSEARGSGKHSRSGSISPPSTQHLVLFHQNSSCASPDSLRVSMSLPGSYWEEKWTLSVLHKKGPDELFSPRTKMEVASRGLDFIDREASGVTGTLSRSGSELRYQAPCPDPVASSFTNRTYDSSPDSSDEDGQEMSRRDGRAATQNAFAEDLSSDLRLIDSTTGGSNYSTENEEQERRQLPGLDLGDVSTLSTGQEHQQLRGLDLWDHSPLASSTDQDYLRRNEGGQEVVCSSRQSDSDAIGCFTGDCTKIKSDDAGTHTPVERDEVSEELKSSTPGCNEELVSQSADAIGPQLHPDEFSFPIQPQSHLGEFSSESSPDAIVSVVPLVAPLVTPMVPTSSPFERQDSSAKDSSTDFQTILDTSSLCDNDSHVDTSKVSHDEYGDLVSSSKSIDLEVEGEDVEKDTSSSKESSCPPSRSKPPLPPSRLGRFNWVWSLGRTSFTEKTVNNKVSKEESSDSEVGSNTSGHVSDADASSSAAAIAAQRRKKSWWRSNCDVVPEDVDPNGSDSVTSDSCVHELGQSDTEKPSTEVAVAVPSESHSKEEVIAEAPVQSQEVLKKPKDMTPSAALQALGQAMLDHVQVLESVLAQKVSVLSIEHMMWTPAVRDKNDTPNRAGLGSKGQGAALAAIAELRKISLALQQM